MGICIGNYFIEMYPEGFLTKIQVVPSDFMNYCWHFPCPWEDQVKYCKYEYEIAKDHNIEKNITAEEKLKWAFKLYDIDRSGRVEQDEFESIFETLCK